MRCALFYATADPTIKSSHFPHDAPHGLPHCPSQPEVGDSNPLDSIGQQNICGLDVAMDQALCVSRRQPRSVSLGEKGERRTATVVADQIDFVVGLKLLLEADAGLKLLATHEELHFYSCPKIFFLSRI